MVKFEHHGNFNTTRAYLGKLKKGIHLSTLEKYGAEGVELLNQYTPKRTGLTAESWSFKAKRTKNGASLSFYNTNIQNGVPVAILIQYGHGTRNGGWVEGIDYINPALRPIFEKLADDAWKEVKEVE